MKFLSRAFLLPSLLPLLCSGFVSITPPSTVSNQEVVMQCTLTSMARSSTAVFLKKDSAEVSRRDMVQNFLLTNMFSSMLMVQNANAIPEQKSYSSNARNFDRLSSGDSSGGSVYNNNPSSASTARRRAMLGCKTDSSRQKAMKMQEMDGLSERECNLKVMDGDAEFMLKALRELDCPTCPYGIKGA